MYIACKLFFIITLVLSLAGQGIAGVSSNYCLFIPHSGRLTDAVPSSVRSKPVHTATAYNCECYQL